MFHRDYFRSHIMTPLSTNRTQWTSLLLLLAACPATAQDKIDLSGQWTFRLDPQDVGINERWCDQSLENPIQLPGSLQEQGYGNDISVDTPWTGSIIDRSWFDEPRYERYRQPGQVKVPFWLQPAKHYIGPAWYQRTVQVPRDWQGRRLMLRLERPHWETRLWVDGTEVGTRNSLATPHEYELTRHLTPGAAQRDQHVLTIRVDNTVKIDVGENAHSVSDHTQSNWNGIVGELALLATDRIWIDDVQVFPDVDARAAKVRVSVGNMTDGGVNGTLVLKAESFNTTAEHAP
ncbi:MAG: hypothetical protein FJ276_36170, partial [Planctomycetes bacterium]|nr:hypothetical protein [Planctomycetota bacterium]